MIGRTIGNYRVTEELGAGGMGQVFRARDTRLNRDVAIKVVPDVFAGDTERLARFEREARLLAGLNHPSVGAVYGLEESGGQRFLIMELVEGEDLSTRLARGAIAPDDALDIALQIASALEAAHEQGVIHRDLKPANIRITEEGRVKVLDFGLAKAFDPADGNSQAALTQSPTAMMSSPTMAGVILGTAAYMSPEQARGKRVDKRADVFAFGIVFWEMLTGRGLFAGDTISDTLAAVLRETPDLDALPAETPRAIRRLIARCLEKDPRRRLRDIGEARILIEDVRSGAVRDDAPPPAIVPPGGRSRVLAYAGWGVAIATAVVASLLAIRQPPVAEAPREVRRAGVVMDVADPSSRVYFSPAISPDGRYVAFVSQNQLWLRDLRELHARAIPGTEGGGAPFWSPDSEWIGFGNGSALMRVRRAGGEPSLIVSMPLGMTLEGTGSAVWDETDRIVIGPNTLGLHTVSARGGEVVHWIVPAEGESDFHEVCLLPGTHGVVAVLHNTQGINDLVLVTPDGTRKTIVHVDDTIAVPAYSPTGHLLFERRGQTAGIWAVAYDLDAQKAVGEPFLAVPGGRKPTVANDGTLCYADGMIEVQSQLAWLDRSGAIVGTIEPPDITTRPFPSISPDGRSVAMSNRFGDSREMFLYDLASGNRRRITFTDYPEEVPQWHPDGVSIVDYTFSPPQVLIIPTQSGGAPRVIAAGIMADVSPDGSMLVYCVQRAGDWNYDIQVRPFDGDSTQAKDLIASPRVDWAPSISPDGKFLAYVSGSSGREEVYVTTFPEASTQWQLSTQGGWWPHWRADGREIVFTTHDELWAVEVAPANGSITFGTPQALCRRPNTNWSGRWPDGFDITADAQRLLVLQPVAPPGDARPAIVTVHNWFEEFRGNE